MRGWATRRTVALAAVCTVAVLAETFALRGRPASLALAPQSAAPTPWGVFHDERWLLSWASSWPTVVLGIGALIVGRGLFTAAQVALAWPTDQPWPGWRLVLGRAVGATALAAVLVSPSASLLVAFAVAPISDLWLTALAIFIGVALFTHHGPIRSWWLRHPRWASVGWVAVSFVILTGAGAVMVAVASPGIYLVAVAAALADAWTWRGIVRSLARPARVIAPIGPLGVLGVVALTVIGVTAAASPRSDADHGVTDVTAHARVRQPVLFVSGYGVRWDGDVPSLGKGFVVREFSYKGTDRHGKPLPYDAAATASPLPDLVRKFAAQVNAWAQANGQPIDIVGESEGALLTSLYLAVTPHPPVRNVVYLSPLVRPARADYPQPGHDGPGLLAGWELRGLAKIVNSTTPLEVNADSSFVHSLADHAEALRGIFGCPKPAVRQAAIYPLADVVGIPPEALDRIPHETVPALHGTLLANPLVRAHIARYLISGTLTDPDGPVEKAVAFAAVPWRTPVLATVPTDCRAAASAARAWLSGT